MGGRREGARRDRGPARRRAVARRSARPVRRPAPPRGLAALLIGDWDVLFLDEPTNHLDVEGIAWLAGHLKGAERRTAARSSSSRTTAGSSTRCAPRRGRCTTASSSPSRAGTRRTSCSASSATAWPRHPSASARTSCARSWRGCRGAAAHLEAEVPHRRGEPAIANEPRSRDRVGSTGSRSRGSARTSSTCSTSESDHRRCRMRVARRRRARAEQVEWRIAPGERTGILGVNGAGKSTLLSLVAGTSGQRSAAGPSRSRKLSSASTRAQPSSPMTA